MKIKLINFIMASISTFSLFFSYINNSLYKETNSLIAISIVSIALTVFYYKNNKIKTNVLQKIISLIFALAMILGKGYKTFETLALLFRNTKYICITIIALLGYYILFINIYKYIDYIIKKCVVTGNEEVRKINSQKNKINIITFILIAISFGIYVIAFYPGILNGDSSYQILQSLNIHTKYADWIIQLDPNINITNHHPVLHTMILGTCFKIGRVILNDNFGIFLSILLQTLMLCFTLSYTIKYLEKINVSLKIRSIVLIIYCVVPMYAFYSVTLVKDVIYTCFILIYIIQIYDFLTYNKDKKMEKKQIILSFITITFICLLRNNGIWVVIFSYVFLIFYSKINRKITLSILVSFILLNGIYNNILLPYLKISNTSIREVLSIPFQQTARYVRYCSEDLNNEEIEIIDKILNIETLANRYQPEVADPVKNEYNKYATTEDLVNYFKVWGKCFFRHPGIYIEAFLNNTYGYFYLSNEDEYIYYKKASILNEEGNIDYHYNECEGLQKILIDYGKEFRNIPFIGLISNIGFNTYIILTISVFLVKYKEKRKYIIMMIPHLTTLLICLASPVNSYFRYAMPYIFAMPITVVFFLKIMRNKKEESHLNTERLTHLNNKCINNRYIKKCQILR